MKLELCTRRRSSEVLDVDDKYSGNSQILYLPQGQVNGHTVLKILLVRKNQLDYSLIPYCLTVLKQYMNFLETVKTLDISSIVNSVDPDQLAASDASSETS